jgi:hypothetical protein
VADPEIVGDDGIVRLSGTIRSAGDPPLVSALGQKECVCWELRAGLDAAPERSEYQSFWLDTAAGPVLVIAERVELEALATRKQQALSVVEADIQDVSARIKQLKEQQRAAAGRSSAVYNKERKRLAKIATLLCAMKAATRGKVHLAGTLESQAKWIDENLHLSSATDGAGEAAGKIFRERWEVVLCEGQTVEVEGISQREAAPELAPTDGYRSRATTLTLRAPPDGKLRVIGIGAIAAERTVKVELRAEVERVRAMAALPKNVMWFTAILLAFFAIVWFATR